MSVDTEVWTRRTAGLDDLSLGDGWDDEGGVLLKEGSGWLVNVFEPEEADSSEVPAELQASASDLRYRVEISLEPSGAPDEGVATLNSAVEAIGSALGGAAVDPRLVTFVPGPSRFGREAVLPRSAQRHRSKRRSRPNGGGCRPSLWTEKAQ